MKGCMYTLDQRRRRKKKKVELIAHRPRALEPNKLPKAARHKDHPVSLTCDVISDIPVRGVALYLLDLTLENLVFF